MGDHLDTLLVTPADDDVRLGVTDLYAFQKPDDPARTTLILDCAPFIDDPSSGFHPDATYQINVDSEGDTIADIAFNVVFTEPDGGSQTATVRRASGAEARNADGTGEVIVERAPVSFQREAAITDAGDYRFFAGVRSDPFFADFEGVQNNLHFTGSDYFAGKNVLAIALEVPNTALGPQPTVALWARTIVRRNGSAVQVDRIGSPGLNIAFNRGEDMNAHNEIEPSQDRGRFFDRFVATLESSGYAAEEAKAIAGTVLPDVLHYDYSKQASFPNGRRLTDDVVDAGLALMTRGQVTTDLTGPHSDYLPDFPYLGPPNQT
jgi:hypothetical protein